nr:MAG TPA: Intron encoded nuclease repeat motif [Crassvirales sp.]
MSNREALEIESTLIKKYKSHGQISAEFNSVSDAADSLGCGTGSISNCLKGRYKTAAGYKWRYKV